jgi:hypothetical protein
VVVRERADATEVPSTDETTGHYFTSRYRIAFCATTPPPARQKAKPRWPVGNRLVAPTRCGILRRYQDVVRAAARRSGTDGSAPLRRRQLVRRSQSGVRAGGARAIRSGDGRRLHPGVLLYSAASLTLLGAVLGAIWLHDQSGWFLVVLGALYMLAIAWSLRAFLCDRKL